MSGEVRSSIGECGNKIQCVKQANESEIVRINQAISSLEAKFTARVVTNNKAIPQTAAFRTNAVGQTESIVGSEPVVNGTNTCEISSCSDGVSLPNASHNSCDSNVNAGSGLYPNNGDLSELTLPTFTDSTSQVPLRFIRNLDQYFSLKRTPEKLRLALVFRAVKEPFAKQWLSSVFDKMKNYGVFKNAFTELLCCPSRQASIRSAIYLDTHDPVSG
jgi:hypothetical protein